jgi:DNA mismatch repair protein MutS2
LKSGQPNKTAFPPNETKNASFSLKDTIQKQSQKNNMKYYHPHTFSKLGFDVILQYISNKAVSEDAKEACMHIQPSDNADFILTELKKVAEFRDILEYDEAIPFNTFSSVGYILSKASIKGNWLHLEELNKVYKWLKVVKDIRNYILKRKEKYPELEKIINQLPLAEHIVPAIERIIDERGNIRDNASPELVVIRREMKSASIEIRTVLHRILRHATDNNWSVDKEITIRNDRLVIPVKAEAKGRISGFIQDISQSGNTIFIEPAESLPLNNKLKELQLREGNEIIRILSVITEKIGENVEDLLYFKDVMTEIDIIRAKALLAVDLKANLPKIHLTGHKMTIRDGFYPVLQLRNKASKAPVVPLNLTFTKNKRIILISGPNAGGKSVSLKTVGLLQLMLQAGFLIPVDERSEFRIFQSLFIDLGDEQSIENDLSTYTSHLFQMRQMGDNMNHHSLFLIDEFGGGTDPQLGGAIAEAFLERFVRQNASGIITTHYGNLKEYAQKTEGIGNAAMEFDTAELKPTYRLIEGVPGRSYAFEIAERVGVHRTIIKKAKEKLGVEQITSEQLISDLEKKNQQLAKLISENERKSAELEKLTTKYDGLQTNISANKKTILNEAKAEAKRLIQEANKKIEHTIREIRESQAEKELTKKLRRDLEEEMPEFEELTDLEELETLPKEKGKDEPKTQGKGGKGKNIPVKEEDEKGKMKILANEKPEMGDWIKLKTSDSIGKLVEIQGNRCVVEMGAVRINLKMSQIVKITPPAEALKTKVTISAPSRLDKMKEVTSKIDIMGMRVDEALPLLEKKMDDALWAGITHISILHGKGTGTLRDAIRKHLRDKSYIKGVYDAPIDQGGDGWTICELKG